MKKVLKFFVQSNAIVFYIAVFLSSCSGKPKSCAVPSEQFGLLKIEAKLFTGNLFGNDCPRPNNSVLLDDLQSIGLNAYVKEKADDATKYVIEVIVNGACSDGGIWTQTFKKGDFTLANIGGGQVRFGIPNIALSSSNEYTIIPRILTPCVGNSTTCNGKTNYRVVIGGFSVGFKASNPMVGGTVVIKNPKTGNLVEFSAVAEESCQ